MYITLGRTSYYSKSSSASNSVNSVSSMISLPGVPPVPGVHDAAPLKEATAAKQQQRTVQQQQETLAKKPQPNEPVHKVSITNYSNTPISAVFACILQLRSM